MTSVHAQPTTREGRPWPPWLRTRTVFYFVILVVLAGYTHMAFDLEWRTAAGRIGPGFFPRFIGVLGMEVNVVLARRLWPRSLRSLFVDRGELTDADRRAYAGYVRAQQHKTSEHVQVGFADPDTGELVIPQEPERNNRKSG